MSNIEQKIDFIKRLYGIKDEDFEAQLLELVREARVNEVHNFGNWNADRGIKELFDVIDKRLAQLNNTDT